MLEPDIIKSGCVINPEFNFFTGLSNYLHVPFTAPLLPKSVCSIILFCIFLPGKCQSSKNLHTACFKKQRSHFSFHAVKSSLTLFPIQCQEVMDLDHKGCDRTGRLLKYAFILLVFYAVLKEKFTNTLAH